MRGTQTPSRTLITLIAAAVLVAPVVTAQLPGAGLATTAPPSSPVATVDPVVQPAPLDPVELVTAWFEPTPLYEALTAGLDACEPRCAAATALDVVGALEAEMAALPLGPTGPSSWLRLAAAQGGTLPGDVPEVPATGLEAAVHGLYAAIEHPVDPALAAEVAHQVERVPVDDRGALASMVNAVALAHELTQEATTGADVALLAADPTRVLHLTTLVSSAAPGALAPELVKEWNLYAEALAAIDVTQMVQAALVLTGAIEAWDRSAPQGTGEIDLPFIFIGGEGDTVHTEDRALLIDRSGNDLYLNNAGAGITLGVGAGLLIDEGDGEDRYEADTFAQAFGLAGVGVLHDEGGADRYLLTQFGQGFGFGGVGVLYDAGAGDDVYRSPDPANNIATKAGALAGVGLVVDEGGNDILQQDALDGFVYGALGGTGLLANRGDGADTYLSRAVDLVLLGTFLGNFTGPIQVSAEAGGLAILYEEGGDDTYTCGERVRQGCQAAGGVLAAALLLDQGGDDTYWMGETITVELVPGVPAFPMGQGAGYGASSAPPGPGVGILHDVAGTDSYTAETFAQGYASGGLGILLDEGDGSDTYATDPPLVGARSDGATWADGTLGLGIDEA